MIRQTADAHSNLSQFIDDICIEAGDKIILPYFKKLKSGRRADIVTAEDTNDISVLVTRADTEAEAFLTEKILQRFPDAVVIGEETYKNESKAGKAEAYLLRIAEADMAFTLDPVDGTNYFACGDNRFVTIAGYWEKGCLQESWIFGHALNTKIHAKQGTGAFIAERMTSRRPFEPWQKIEFRKDHKLQETELWPDDRGAFPPRLFGTEGFPLRICMGLGQGGETLEYLRACARANGKPDYGRAEVRMQETLWDFPSKLAMLEAGGMLINEASPDDPLSYKVGLAAHYKQAKWAITSSSKPVANILENIRKKLRQNSRPPAPR